MIAFPPGVRVWLATGHTDMRKGFATLALLVQEKLKTDPHCGHLFVFRGRRGDLIKVIWHDGQGACLFSKRLERGRFIWPTPSEGAVTISPAQAELARARVREAGLEDDIEIRLADYRDTDDGPYDKIASVGMVEHVGTAQLPAYFTHLRELLKRHNLIGGVAGQVSRRRSPSAPNRGRPPGPQGTRPPRGAMPSCRL